MKYVLFGDIHGKDLSDLFRFLSRENPDVLICTGDFDQVKSIRQFMDLEKTYLEAGKQVLIVLGNHDSAVFYNDELCSETLRSQNIDISKLHSELRKDPEAYRYLEALLPKIYDVSLSKITIELFLDENKFQDLYRTVVLHAALGGNMKNYGIHPDEVCVSSMYAPRDVALWAKLKTPYDYDLNFKKMSEKGFNVMIRGHDHNPRYVYLDKLEGIVGFEVDEIDNKFELLPNRYHVINPGAIFDGVFATIDTSCSECKFPLLKYHWL